jgi:iron complex outermembrane receptor protein
MTIHLSRLHLFASGVSALAMIVPVAANAQSAATPAVSESAPTTASPAVSTGTTANGEIVVTAQRRNERQVDVPISITALSAAKLETANVQNLGDIGKITPALRFDSQSAFVQPSIRGIGTGITTSGGGSNIGIYIDGFYSPNPVAADFQLLIVSSIQVLNGRQGTLFGHNTTGGAILITSADPSETTAVQAKASYGSFNAQRYQGYATFGIAKGIAMDVEGIYAKGDGFQTNILDNDHHVGAYENWTVRTGLKIDVTDGWTILGRYTHSHMDDPSSQLTNSNTDTTIDPTTGQPWGITTFTAPGLYTTDHDKVAANIPRFTTTNSDIGQLTIRGDLGFANIASYTQYRHEHTDQSEDLDQVGLDIFQLGLPIIDKTWTQEVLVTSKPGPRLQWTAGVFYFNNQDTWITNIDNYVGTPVGRLRLGGSGSTTRSLAGFADATYQLTDRLFLTGGVRVSRDSVVNAFWNTMFLADSYTRTDGTVVPAPNGEVAVPNVHSTKATPRVVLRYKPDDHSSVYASYSKGYKAAITDVGGSCQDPPGYTCNKIKPEDVDAFEVGYKYAAHNFSVETAAYYYNYKNLQVSEYLGAALAYITNAAKSQIYGLEGSVHYDFDSHLSVDLGGSWNHARYKTFGSVAADGTVTGAPIYASCPTTPFPVGSKYFGSCSPGSFDYVNTDTILHNTHMQHTPDFTGNATARYTTGMTQAGQFTLSGNVYYSSSLYFSPSGTQFRQPSYATLQLRAEWLDPSKRFSLAVFGDNVTDTRYRTQVQFNAFGIGAQWNTPATVGVEAGVKF